MPFTLPDSDIVSVIDAPPTPLVQPGPGGRYIAVLTYQAHPPIAMLARPSLPLAGLRLDPVIAGRKRTRRFTGIEVLAVADGTCTALALPADAQVSTVTWAPDGERFAFLVDEPDGIGVWVGHAPTATAAQVPGLRVSDVLGAEPPAIGGTVAWSRDGRSLYALSASQPGRAEAVAAAVAAAQQPVEPRIEETAGKQSQMATFQNLLRTAADEDAFEALATTVPVRVDQVSGAAVPLGQAGLYQFVAESPDGGYLLVGRLLRPFSFRVPYHYFTRRAEVWTAAGEPAAVVADLPVSDEVRRMGVPTGPRRICWDERAPARLIWTQALDGGDPMASAEHRDEIMTLAAPFSGPAEPAFKVAHRCLGWMHLDEPGRVLLTEHDRDRRWLTSWLCDLASPDRNKVLFDLAEDDAYGDPGVPLMRLHPDGTRTVLQDGPVMYLAGEGATPDGDRPFLHRMDLESGQIDRMFASADGAYQAYLCFAEGRRDQVVIWHESQAEPPNLRVVTAGPDPGGEHRQLTAWPDPHPQLTGMAKRLIVTDRGDGVTLSGLLHLPPGYDQAADGPLPLVIWAYPHDYGSAGTAGQVRGSSQRFTRLAAADPAWFVLRGYAVLANATMPVIGDPETKNDTYIEQITAAAAAHVRALAEAGIADPARVAVAGHSYGAFMTANLLAHTDLFAVGIARSGAYNRTLTPFGFQTERRSFWEAPAVYDLVSPFRYADRIKAPLLLVHGADDANSGTFPVQSERLFQAIGGTGGTARLVILPFENHGYLARESVLHVLAEQFAWLERWLGERP
ncbi:MAG TPA: prolyl oligopeptidase family serine peptidase [Streptosporangiaceae bacterium]|nr:prolyl oligopeptidase family serine peptidase [Streptosporangiaceae bacterium]